MPAHYWPPVDRSALLWHNARGGAAMPGESMTTTIEGAGDWFRWLVGGGATAAFAIIAWFLKDRASSHEKEILRLKADNESKIRDMLERSSAEQNALRAEVERTRQASAEREALRREQQENWKEFSGKLESIREAINTSREATAAEVAVLRENVVRLSMRCDSFERRVNEMSDFHIKE